MLEVMSMEDVYCSNKRCIERRKDGSCRLKRISVAGCRDGTTAEDCMRASVPTNIERSHGVYVESGRRPVK